MSSMNDQSYHEARAQTELRLAEEATDPAVAQAHRELAALHKRQLIKMVECAEADLQKPVPGTAFRRVN